MNKMIKDGKVAVLYSPGYGAGWSSWNTETPDMIFDMTIVSMVLRGNTEDEIKAVAKLKWPDAYLGGVKGLNIVWLDQGTEFRINEYDGNENVEVKNDFTWIVA